MTVTSVGASPRRFRESLLAWYRANRRDLPWRRTSDPYAIWLSEIMLQQTTVRTVEPRWLRFLERFPTVEALAAAPLDDVLHEWTGLGYYARARNLHRAAGAIVRDFGGSLPASYELLLALPGMGVYTAAAVASIAFGEAVPVLDANVERVAARLLALEENARTPAAKRTLRAHMEMLIDPSHAGDFNQAMMELGATICTPRNPRCRDCPVAKNCRGYVLGSPELYPKLPAKAPLASVREVAVIIRRNRRILLLQRPATGSFAGMWELPRGECRDGEEAFEAAMRIVAEQTGLRCVPRSALFKLKHTVMRRSIELHVIDTGTWEGIARPTFHVAAEWTTAEEWLDLPKSTTQADVAAYLAGRSRRRPRTSIPENDTAPDLFSDPAPDA
ncbi:A/G-specific adenine glycosylase [bacterium]|nr:A/G-specific adenine glycosylase [bacterium]